MSVKVVVHAEIVTATDLFELIEKWLPIASPFDQERYFASVIGVASGLMKKDQTPETAEKKENSNG